MRVKPDPPIRPDGLCAQCHGPRKYAKWNKYGGDQAVFDPFCSSPCCRTYHGCPLPKIDKPRVEPKPKPWQTDNRRRYRQAHLEHEREMDRAYKQRRREQAA